MAPLSDVGLTAMPLSWERKRASGCGFFFGTKETLKDGNDRRAYRPGKHNKDYGDNDDQQGEQRPERFQPPVISESKRRNRRAARRSQYAIPVRRYIAQADGPEVTKAMLGFIALTDAAPLFVAKEKGIFAKYGMPDVEVQKQASWGATRDNLVLGSRATASTARTF